MDANSRQEKSNNKTCDEIYRNCTSGTPYRSTFTYYHPYSSSQDCGANYYASKDSEYY